MLKLPVTSSPGAAGLSGGGTMYAPVVNTKDPHVMVVSCDMGGLYRHTTLVLASDTADAFTQQP
jgi:hypothetical protein